MRKDRSILVDLFFKNLTLNISTNEIEAGTYLYCGLVILSRRSHIIYLKYVIITNDCRKKSNLNVASYGTRTRWVLF